MRRARRQPLAGDARNGRRRPSSRIVLPFVAGVLACLVYLNALDNPFVYDDHDTVVANPSLVDLSNVKFLLVYSPFRPVVNLSYAIDRAFWGYDPFGYHLTNVALHAITTVLLYLFIAGLLEDRSQAIGEGEGHDGAIGRAAFAAAAVFATHPLLSEAVGYVSGRSEVLCAAWFLSACVLARHAMRTGRITAGLGAMVAGVLAAATKETAAALPVVLLAYDWLLRPGDDRARRARLWRVFVPVLAVMLAAGLYRLAVFADTGRSAASGLNLLTQATVVWRYVRLLAWPAGQSIVHDVSRVTSIANPVGWLAAAGVVGVLGGAVLVRRTQPLVAVGIVWFFAVLAPSSTLVVLREAMAEHRAYLAVAGAMLVLAVLLQRAFERGDPGLRKALTVAVPAVLIVLSSLTVARNKVWANPVALWAEAARRAPAMWEPHYALADALRESGNCLAAVSEYRQVVAIHPAHRDAYTNLGICLAQTQQYDEAEVSFRRALEIDPAFARGYTNLGALAIVQGDAEAARSYYREALAQDPNNVLARMQLASLYEQTFHDYHAAARMCGEARQLAPATPGVVDCVERNQRLAAAKDAGR